MEVAAAKEYSLILKGKRTKRQRPQSPIPFSISPPLVSFESPNMEEEVTDLGSKEKISTFDGLGFDVQKENVVMITSSYSSASSSSNTILKVAAAATAEEYDEDQDMANCLILLAQGHSLPQNQPQEVIIQYKNNNNNNKNEDSYRFSSRKFLETCSNNGGGKSGYYVYQCKTCDRTFPSFQALGGHRASHKKPKTTSFYSNLDLKKPIYNDTVLVTTNTTTYNKSSNRSSLMLYGKANNKVHECGICGAEFTSGQALGGHMRRHRGAVAVAVAAAVAIPAAANTELSLSSMSFDQISSDGQDFKAPVTKRAKINTVVSLDLDLNLPAPEDENRFNGFSFASKQKQEQEHEEIKKRREEQKSLVLTTTTLVDCHY